MLLLLYLVVNAARFVMVFFSYPIVANTGYGLSCKGAVMLGFGGIHGAVGLALALLMYEEYEGNTDAARVMFHIGGVTVLSLLVNGLASAPLLNYLGLAKLDKARMTIKVDVMQQIVAHSNLIFEQVCGDNKTDKDEVRKL